jgi:hypothetical protein
MLKYFLFYGEYSVDRIGKILIVVGIILIISGIILVIFKKLPFIPGKLPGDIVMEKENFKFYFPVGTCIIASIVLSLVFYIISKFIK